MNRDEERMIREAHEQVSEEAQYKAALKTEASKYQHDGFMVLDMAQSQQTAIGEAVFALIRMFPTADRCRELIGVVEDSWREAHKVTIHSVNFKDGIKESEKPSKPPLPRSYVSTKSKLLEQWDAAEEAVAAITKRLETYLLFNAESDPAKAAEQRESLYAEYLPAGFLDPTSSRYAGTKRQPGLGVVKFRADFRVGAAALAAVKPKTAGAKKGGTVPKAVSDMVAAVTRAIHDAWDRGCKAGDIYDTCEAFVDDLKALPDKADEAILAEAVAEEETATAEVAQG